MASAMAGHLVIHELLIAVFILLASPVTTIILMRAARTHENTEVTDAPEPTEPAGGQE